MGTTTAMSQRRVLPSKLAADYWKLPADQRKQFAVMVKSQLASNEREAERKKSLAEGKGAVVSFRTSAEQYRLLQMITDAIDRNVKPGAVAGELFDWAFPALEAIVGDLDPGKLLHWSLRKRWGDPWSKLRLVGAAVSPEPEAS